jgi:HAMP domain-containing protein
VITPIPNEPHCSEASCHAHPKEHRVLGDLEVSLKLDSVDSELTQMEQRIGIRALAEIAVICPAIFLFARRFIRQPIEQLIASAGAISRMDLDQPVAIPAHAGEVTELAESFDQMRVRLRDALAENSQSKASASAWPSLMASFRRMAEKSKFPARPVKALSSP